MIENFWTFLVELKLPFELRLLIFAAIAGALLLANSFHFIVKKRETWIGLTAYLQRLQGSRFGFLPPWDWIGWLDSLWRKVLVAEFMFIRHGNLAPYNILAGITLAVLTSATLISRPYILASIPQPGSYMLNVDQTIELEFSLPVDIEELSFNVSPDTGGYWDFEKILFGIPLKWKAKFYPYQSFFPERKIVVYVVGLKSIWNPSVIHEQAVEFYSPKLPNVIAVNPTAGSTLVPTDTNVEIEYDSVLGDFVKFDFEVAPKRELEVVENGGTRQVLAFDQELEQGQEYALAVKRTPVSYDTATNEVIETGETEEVEKVKFKTVDAPLVASYQPKGESVKTDEVIKIVFQQPMDAATVESNFTISPQIGGTVTWEDEGKTFIFTPANPLPKETKYQMTFKAGIRNIYGGVTETDLNFEFETIGRVAVSSFYPSAGFAQIDPEKTNVVVEFNQEVDRASAQSKFSISPYVSGSFVWDSNKMIYATAGKLDYLTTYAVKVAPGVKSVYGLDSNQDFTATFATRSKTVELSVPQYYQNPITQTFNCNLAVTKMVLAYRGINVTQDEVKSAIGVGQNPNTSWVEGYGTHTAPIANYLTSKGISFEVKTGWNLADLAKEVEKGNPVILWWYNRYSQPKGTFTLPGGYTGYKGMHSEVVRGFVGSSSNPTQLLVNDPWRGQLIYDRTLFLSTWSYMNYTAIVVR